MLVATIISDVFFVISTRPSRLRIGWAYGTRLHAIDLTLNLGWIRTGYHNLDIRTDSTVLL